MARSEASNGLPLHRHAVAAVGALLISLLLHGLLLSRLPPMNLGGLRDLPVFPDYPSIALARVESKPKPPAREEPRFRPENPAEVKEVWAGALALAPVPAASLPIPQAPETSTGPVKGEAQSLAEPPDLAPAAASWDPRQEIIQIDRPLLDDRLAALPRRFEAATPRTDRVPDVVLPVEQPVELASGLRGGLPVGIESMSRPTVGDPGLPASAEGVLFQGRAMNTEVLLPRPALDTKILSPPPADVEPVEQHLQLATRVFRAADEPDHLYFELQIGRRSEATLPVLPKDLLLVQDCSESMTPWKLAECKRGLRRWIEQLNPGDRFEVMAFRDDTTLCFGGWRLADDLAKAKAYAFIDGLRAQGNTDVYASLQAALALAHAEGRPVLLGLITDGRPTAGVTTGSAIIEGFTTQNASRLSVFALAGGQRANRFLLDLISYRNRGDSLVVEEPAQIPYAMDRWGAETRNPVLSDLSYGFSGVDDEAVYPATLTHLYLDRPLVLYGRVPAEHPPAAFQIVGRSGEALRDMVFPLDLASAEAGDEGLRTRWAWHRIYEWIGVYLRAPDEKIRAEIQALAEQYGLVVPYGFGSTVPRW